MRRGALIALTAVQSLVACGSNLLGFTNEEDAGSTASLPPTFDGAVLTDAVADIDVSAPYDASDQAVSCATTPCVVELVGGALHFCARTRDSKVWCWGAAAALPADVADAGSPDASSVVAPRLVPVDGATQLSAADSLTCARITDGSLRCWGTESTEVGLLGLAQAADAGGIRSIRFDEFDAGGAEYVVVGPRAIYARTSSEAVISWGLPYLTAHAPPDDGLPRVASLLDPSVIEMASAYTTIALTAGGKALSWGGSEVTLGRESPVIPDPVPHQIPTLPAGITSVAMSWALGCAVAGGDVYCWGTKARLPLRQPTQGPARAQRVYANPLGTKTGHDRVIVRMTDGTLECQGTDYFGECGIPYGAVVLDESNTFVPKFAPANLVTGDVVSVAMATTTTCVLLRDGSVECFGGNKHGELGHGTADDSRHSNPERIRFE
ncbi:RCC1 domain-containing protein [Labilithrix luteola]|nr:hypothetical protein [Labilithrix luteola]